MENEWGGNGSGCGQSGCRRGWSTTRVNCKILRTRIRAVVKRSISGPRRCCGLLNWLGRRKRSQGQEVGGLVNESQTGRDCDFVRDGINSLA